MRTSSLTQVFRQLPLNKWAAIASYFEQKEHNPVDFHPWLRSSLAQSINYFFPFSPRNISEAGVLLTDPTWEGSILPSAPDVTDYLFRDTKQNAIILTGDQNWLTGITHHSWEVFSVKGFHAGPISSSSIYQSMDVNGQSKNAKCYKDMARKTDWGDKLGDLGEYDEIAFCNYDWFDKFDWWGRRWSE